MCNTHPFWVDEVNKKMIRRKKK